MKKILTLFCMGVLGSTLCTGLVACNGSNDPNENEIRPVRVSKEVADFFDKNVSLIARSIFPTHSWDEWDGKSSDYDVCVIINDMKDLPEVVGFDEAILNYPAIDFESHTLVIGQYATVSSGAYHLASQSIVIELNTAILNLVIAPSSNSIHLPALTNNPFWGIYPKLTEEAISIITSRKNK